jgi:hypothetical protein
MRKNITIGFTPAEYMRLQGAAVLEASYYHSTSQLPMGSLTQTRSSPEKPGRFSTQIATVLMESRAHVAALSRADLPTGDSRPNIIRLLDFARFLSAS